MIQNWIIFDGSEHYSDIPCGSEIPNAGTQPGTHDQYAPGTGAATKFAPMVRTWFATTIAREPSPPCRPFATKS